MGQLIGNKLSASMRPREIRTFPASDSEKPLVVYLSSDSIRRIKGYSAKRGVPFESFMSGNLLFVEEPERSTPGEKNRLDGQQERLLAAYRRVFQKKRSEEKKRRTGEERAKAL